MEGFVSIALTAIVVLAIIFVKMAVVIIPQSETKIIERLGKYYDTLKPGVNIIIPFIDRAKTIITMTRGRYAYSNSIDLREQVYDFDKQNVITKDNIQMQINALLYFQIVDPFKAVYEINNLPNAIEKLTQTTLRNIIGEMELDQTLTSRDTINTITYDMAINKYIAYTCEKLPEKLATSAYLDRVADGRISFGSPQIDFCKSGRPIIFS